MFAQVLRNNVGGTTGLRGPSSIAISSDGKKAYVAAVGQGAIHGGVVAFDIDVNQPDPHAMLTTFDDIESLSVTTAGGDDRLTIRNAPDQEVASVTLRTGHAIDGGGMFTALATDGDDVVVLQDFDTSTTLFLGGGNDEVQVRSTAADAALEIHGDAGQDTINVQTLGPNVTFNAYGESGNDTFRVAGKSIASPVNLFGDSPTQTDGLPDVPPGDTLIFDPENPNPAVPNFSLSNPLTPDGFAQVNGAPRVDYQSMEGVHVIAAPLIDIGIPDRSPSEGQSLSLKANVTPLGLSNQLIGPVAWDIDGDGQFGEVTGDTLNLSWGQLVDLGLNDDGVYQIGVRATNADGFSSEKFTTVTISNAAPTVTLSGPDASTVGDVYTLGFTATDPGDDRISEWRVDWGDGSAFEVFGSGTTAAAHTFMRPGSFEISVSPVDEDSTPDAYPPTVKNVEVGLTSALVNNGGPYTVRQGDSITLDATAAGDPTGVAWILGGDFVQGANGFHATIAWDELVRLDADAAGVYQLIALVDYGADSVASYTTLEVINVSPTADLSNFGPVNEGDSATVAFTNPFDPSPTDLAPLSYSYDFDNDGVFEINHSPDPAAVVPASFLPDDGIYTIRARIASSDNAETEYFTDIVVHNTAPTLTLSGAPTTEEGFPYTLGLSANDPGDDTITNWIIDWGDGTVEAVGNMSSAAHDFADDGTQTINVTAIDEDGSYTTSKSVNVSNVAPKLRNIATPVARVDEDQIIQLTGEIVDPGILDSFVLDINWGDGNQQSVSLAAGINQFNIGHRYLDDGPSPGNATPFDSNVISLSVRDDDGGASTMSTTSVTIDNVAPQIPILEVQSLIVREHEPVVLVGNITDPGSLDTHQVMIDWGDGTSSLGAVDQSNMTFTASHPFINDTASELKSFTITATLTDDDGGITSATTNVQIENPPQPLEITSITVNDGDAQRSQISKIVVAFNRNTNMQELIDDGAIASAISIAGAAGDVAPISFTYDEAQATLTINLVGPSSQSILQDGFFQLRLDTTIIHAAGDPSNQLDDSDGTVDNVFRFDFHRLLGDYDGDTDVDINDRNLFFAAYESHQGDLAYDVIYDLNVNGMVDRDDYRIWRSQYRKSL